MKRTTAPAQPVSIAVPIITALAMAIAILGAFFGSGALGGTSVNEASGGWLDTDSTLLSPASAAFRIWSLIYLGLVVYAIWQFSRTARTSTLQSKARGWIIASALLNALWIGVVQLDWLAASVGVIALLLVVLIRLHVLLVRQPASSAVERWLMWIVFGVYLGWVNVATIANISALLASLGFGQNEDWTTVLAVALLGVAALIGVATCWFSRGHLGAALAMSWGVAWIGVSRLDAPNDSEPVAIAAFVASGVLLLVALILSVLLRRRPAARERA